MPEEERGSGFKQGVSETLSLMRTVIITFAVIADNTEKA